MRGRRGGGGRPGCHRRRDPGPAADARSASGGPSSERSARAAQRRRQEHEVAAQEIGPVGDLPAEQVVAAARPRPRGPHDLARGDPVPGHAAVPRAPAVPGPQLPHAARDPGRRRQPWGPVNDAGLGYMAEYVMATSHSGAHMDALAHMTVGRRHALVRRRQRRRAPHRLRPGPRRRRQDAAVLHARRADRRARPPRRRLPAQGLADRRGRDGGDLRGRRASRSGPGTSS